VHPSRSVTPSNGRHIIEGHEISSNLHAALGPAEIPSVSASALENLDAPGPLRRLHPSDIVPAVTLLQAFFIAEQCCSVLFLGVSNLAPLMPIARCAKRPLHKHGSVQQRFHHGQAA
jgi:hypothetical protein